MIFFETASISQVFSLNLARKAYELNMEKRRGDKLLFQVRIFLFTQSILPQMLPPTVAQALQLKKAVTAETYESVTVKRLKCVFFSTFTGGNMGWFIKICYHRWGGWGGSRWIQYFIIGG